MEILQSSWRGRLLTARKDAQGKYIAMAGTKSMLYIPVHVKPNTTYRVTLEVKSESGNGLAYCNIFGNRKYDFSHSRLMCEGSEWRVYDIDVVTRDFPKTLPLVLRIWRSPDGTGTILLRRIIFEEITDESKKAPQLISVEKKGPLPPPPPADPPPKPPQPPKHINKPKPLPKNTLTARERRREEKKKRRAGRRVHPAPIPVQMPPAKILPEVIGEDGIKVSVVLSVFNRRKMFRHTLQTYANQTLPKNEFELVVVDDKSTDDIKGLCKEMAEEFGLQFQYVLIDRMKGAITPETFTPALSNNIGFKLARGSVIVVTGPETLQKEVNLEASWKCANEGKCFYGNVYRSSTKFVDELRKDDKWKTISFRDMIAIPGAKEDVSVTKGWWWYYIAVRKEHVLAINGVDERYMRGVTGEDDNFAARLIASGVPLARNTTIEGIHQDHSREDRDERHGFRFDKRKWRRFRRHNINLMSGWSKTKEPVANKTIDWGSFNAIIEKEIF